MSKFDNLGKVVAVVPIRKESTRVPGKNFRDLAGRPIWQYCLETLANAQAQGLIDKVVIMPSPDIMEDRDLFMKMHDYMSTLAAWPDKRPDLFAFHPRPQYLCDPDVTINSILQWAHQRLGADTYFQTHVVNPFITLEDIERGLDILNRAEADRPVRPPSSVIGVNPIQQKLWTAEKGLSVPVNHSPGNMVPTQTLRRYYEETCAYSFFRATTLLETGNRHGATPRFMEVSRISGFDIDWEDDFELAEAIAQARLHGLRYGLPLADVRPFQGSRSGFDIDTPNRDGNTITVRPWGQFRTLAEGPGWRTKKLIIRAGHRTSLQRHYHRSEDLLVVEGHGQVELGGEIFQVLPGAFIRIEREHQHRIQAMGPDPLVIVETWLGDDLREDDIERLADDYGRVKEATS